MATPQYSSFYIDSPETNNVYGNVGGTFQPVSGDQAKELGLNIKILQDRGAYGQGNAVVAGDVTQFAAGEGQAPTAFQEQAAPGQQVKSTSGVVSDTSSQQANAKKVGDTLIYAPPELPEVDTTDIEKLEDDQLALLDKRQKELDAQYQEDLNRQQASFETAKGELQFQQEDQLAQAEGRTRIGGFLVKTEIDDINRMKRGFRLELAQLNGMYQQALTEAQRAYSEGNFQLAATRLDVMKEAQDRIQARKSQHIQDLINTQRYYEMLNRPAIQLQEAQLQQIFEWMTTDPSVFDDITIEGFLSGKYTFADFMMRWAQSDKFTTSSGLELSDYPSSYQEYLLAKEEGYKGSYLDYQKYKATQFGTEGPGDGNDEYDENIAQGDLTSWMLGRVGEDGYVDPKDFWIGLAAWTQDGFEAEDYYNRFIHMFNPDDRKDIRKRIGLE